MKFVAAKFRTSIKLQIIIDIQFNTTDQVLFCRPKGGKVLSIGWWEKKEETQPIRKRYLRKHLILFNPPTMVGLGGYK